jgi:hypothetical protein
MTALACEEGFLKEKVKEGVSYLQLNNKIKKRN